MIVHNTWTAINKNGYDNYVRLKLNKRDRFLLENVEVHKLNNVSLDRMNILVFQFVYIMALPTHKKKEKEIELVMGWFPFLLNH